MCLLKIRGPGLGGGRCIIFQHHLDNLSYIYIILAEEIKMISLGERIKRIRESLGLNQQTLAEKLSVSRPSISQIENGDRKVSAEELKKLAEIFNLSADALLDPRKEPQILIRDRQEVYASEAKPSMRIDVPQKNLEKFREVLIYILNKVGAKSNIGETVIYKLLYFIDFDYYEKYEEQLIGATYMKNRYGPTPLEFRKIVDQMIAKGELIEAKDKYFEYPQRKYLPLRKADLSLLRGNEIEVIDDVLDRLSDMNSRQISDYSHNDVPWLTTEDGSVIEYEAVFYRTPPYSVREYDDTV
jgi:transcriptional regulator with XRE-family HTH domain